MWSLHVHVWGLRKVHRGSLKRGEGRGHICGESLTQSPDAISLNSGWYRVTVSFRVFALVLQNSANRDTVASLTWIARLADFSPAPVKIVTFLADPVTWLVLYWALVSCIEDGRMLRMRVGQVWRVAGGYTYRDPDECART